MSNELRTQIQYHPADYLIEPLRRYFRKLIPTEFEFNILQKVKRS